MWMAARRDATPRGYGRGPYYILTRYMWRARKVVSDKEVPDIMMRLLLSLGAVLFIVTAGLAADKNTWQGYITDNVCGIKGTDLSKASIAATANQCVRQKGAKYALYDPASKKTYVLEPQARVGEDAGYFVMVEGTLAADTIQVTSVRMAKAPNENQRTE